MTTAPIEIPKADLRPIKSTLRSWFRIDPDLFAVAAEGIRRIAADVRNWFGSGRRAQFGWQARVGFFGVVFDFVYGCCNGFERLIFVGLSCGGQPMPRARQIEPDFFDGLIASIMRPWSLASDLGEATKASWRNAPGHRDAPP